MKDEQNTYEVWVVKNDGSFNPQKFYITKAKTVSEAHAKCLAAAGDGEVTSIKKSDMEIVP